MNTYIHFYKGEVKHGPRCSLKVEEIFKKMLKIQTHNQYPHLFFFCSRFQLLIYLPNGSSQRGEPCLTCHHPTHTSHHNQRITTITSPANFISKYFSYPSPPDILQCPCLNLGLHPVLHHPPSWIPYCQSLPISKFHPSSTPLEE